MPATESSTLDGLLKRYYGSEFTDQQQLVPDFLETIPSAPDKPGGEDGAVRFGAGIQIRQSGGAQNQEEEFRENESGVKKQFVISSKINIWPVEITNFAIATSKSTEQAFMSGLDREMKEALMMMKKDMNRQCFGYGFGVLALVNGTLVNSTALVVDTPGNQYFFPGMRIDIVTLLAAGVVEAQNVKVSSVSSNGTGVTLASAVSVTDNSFIVRSGMLNSNPTDGKELMGLQGISDDTTLFTTFQGLSRSSFPVTKGTITGAASAALTGDLLQRGADAVERLSGKVVDVMVSHRNQRRQYLSLVTPLKRFMSDKLDAGFQVLEWNGIPWLVSHECQQDSVYQYNKASVRKFNTLPIKLDDSGGTTVHHIPRHDTVECYYKHYGNIGTYQPNAVGVINALATLTN